MPSTWLSRASAWVVAGFVAVLLLDPAASPVNLASIAALAIAAIVAWSFQRPSANSPDGVRHRLPVPAHMVGPMRSFDPDAAGRPRPRAPGA